MNYHAAYIALACAVAVMRERQREVRPGEVRAHRVSREDAEIVVDRLIREALYDVPPPDLPEVEGGETCATT